jgi:hypothetical protein
MKKKFKVSLEDKQWHEQAKNTKKILQYFTEENEK